MLHQNRLRQTHRRLPKMNGKPAAQPDKDSGYVGSVSSQKTSDQRPNLQQFNKRKVKKNGMQVQYFDVIQDIETHNTLFTLA